MADAALNVAYHDGAVSNGAGLGQCLGHLCIESQAFLVCSPNRKDLVLEGCIGRGDHIAALLRCLLLG